MKQTVRQLGYTLVGAVSAAAAVAALLGACMSLGGAITVSK